MIYLYMKKVSKLHAEGVIPSVCQVEINGARGVSA